MLTRTQIDTERIVITKPDFDRLSELTRSARYRATYAALLSGLQGELDRGTVVDQAEVPRRVVTMRSRVKIRDLDTGEVERFTLCYPDEANVTSGWLSVLAPLGTALLGTRAGQTITIQVPRGQRRLRIERILYQPEAAGRLDL